MVLKFVTFLIQGARLNKKKLDGITTNALDSAFS